MEIATQQCRNLTPLSASLFVWNAKFIKDSNQAIVGRISTIINLNQYNYWQPYNEFYKFLKKQSILIMRRVRSSVLKGLKVLSTQAQKSSMSFLSDGEQYSKPQKVKIKKIRKPINEGHWLTAENVLYKKFLQDNFHIFRVRNVHRKGRIFKKMEKVVKSRTAIQCRSHHQKLEMKFPSIEDILQYLEQQITENSRGQETPTKENVLYTKDSSFKGIETQKFNFKSAIFANQEYFEMPSIYGPSYHRQEQQQVVRFWGYNLDSLSNQSQTHNIIRIPTTPQQKPIRR